MISKFLLPLCVCLSAALPAAAALGIKPDGHLDMPVLRKAYMESEFEKVRVSLEGFLKKRSGDATRDEKIFSHMYLGVICAADSNTEVKAESHFNALLQLSPHIEPVDMFVPPKIQDLFDRIKRDFLKKKDYESRFDAFGNPLARPDSTVPPDKVPVAGKPTEKPSGSRPGKTSGKTPPKASGKSHAWVWWTVGSTALVAAGVGAYALLASQEPPDPNRKFADARQDP